jgi:hypothetical protein
MALLWIVLSSKFRDINERQKNKKKDSNNHDCKKHTGPGPGDHINYHLFSFYQLTPPIMNHMNAAYNGSQVNHPGTNKTTEIITNQMKCHIK